MCPENLKTPVGPLDIQFFYRITICSFAPALLLCFLYLSEHPIDHHLILVCNFPREMPILRDHPQIAELRPVAVLILRITNFIPAHLVFGDIVSNRSIVTL